MMIHTQNTEIRAKSTHTQRRHVIRRRTTRHIIRRTHNKNTQANIPEIQQNNPQKEHRTQRNTDYNNHTKNTQKYTKTGRKIHYKKLHRIHNKNNRKQYRTQQNAKIIHNKKHKQRKEQEEQQDSYRTKKSSCSNSGLPAPRLQAHTLSSRREETHQKRTAAPRSARYRFLVCALLAVCSLFLRVLVALLIISYYLYSCAVFWVGIVVSDSSYALGMCLTFVRKEGALHITSSIQYSNCLCSFVLFLLFCILVCFFQFCN